MSLFPRPFYTPDQSFAPLVRLLNDWDSYTQEGLQQTGNHRHRHGVPTFSPKFDVVETDNDYQLHGELGGIEKKDVHLEFTDESTLVIKGRVEKTYTTDEAPETAGAIEGTTATSKSGSHKATVQEEDQEEEGERKESSEVAHRKQQPLQEQKKKPMYKYWLSERSVGEFSRVFQFPGRVERDGVTAGLENGILTVKVPKAKKLESRRINIA